MPLTIFANPHNCSTFESSVAVFTKHESFAPSMLTTTTLANPEASNPSKPPESPPYILIETLFYNTLILCMLEIIKINKKGCRIQTTTFYIK
ncbi:MAG: hypothetical protein JEZ09_21380 [Salinivirgaceae bacterium]|nr:hypothetical protein [Salinivirgaceae bacterium]